jgi:hypothetical protein
MRFSSLLPALALPILLVAACGGGSQPSPTASTATSPEAGPAGPDPLSDEVMKREADTNHAVVKHVVLSANQKELALDVLRRVRAGESMEVLMKQYSKDPGSKDTGESYEVRPDSELVFEFKRFSLRLRAGEAGMVSSQFGWHVIKRIE